MNRLLWLTYVGVFVSSCVYARPPRETSSLVEAPVFERHHIDVGSDARQTVLTGFILDGPVAELVVVRVDESGERSVTIFTFDGGEWEPSVESVLGEDVSFVDVASIGERDRLITYAPDALRWFDPLTTTERTLVEVTSSFERPRRGEVPHVDVTEDVNDDGRDDLVVPDVDGFWVVVQTESGAFAEPVKVGPVTDMRRIVGADGYRYAPWTESRVHVVDFNGDRRRDLVFWNELHFEVHLQDAHGRFSSKTHTFTSDVAFDSDRLSSITAGDMTGKVLHSLDDLDGDGTTDLVVFSLEGRRIRTKRSVYEVHLGVRTADGTRFAQEPAMAFRSDGIQLGMERYDFDGDGALDLFFTTIDVDYLESSWFKRFKGFMGDDIWLGLEFYKRTGGGYPDRPNAIRRIQLDGRPSSSEPGWVPLDIVLRGATHERRNTQKDYLRAFNRTLLMGDVTGDGRVDALIEATHRELRVSVGAPGAALFAPRVRKVQLYLPADEEYTWLADINRDEKGDILMHHPPPHGVTLLITR